MRLCDLGDGEFAEGLDVLLAGLRRSPVKRSRVSRGRAASLPPLGRRPAEPGGTDVLTSPPNPQLIEVEPECGRVVVDAEGARHLELLAAVATR
jgi:hypothetical protein